MAILPTTLGWAGSFDHASFRSFGYGLDTTIMTLRIPEMKPSRTKTILEASHDCVELHATEWTLV
jgi:hypothetical protein